MAKSRTSRVAKPQLRKSKRLAAKNVAVQSANKPLGNSGIITDAAGICRDSPQKRRKTCSNVSAVSANPVGVVDPNAQVQGSIVHSAGDDDPMDAMMVLINPDINSDKYYILQLIELDSRDGDGSKYSVFTRWGRTGNRGTALLQNFANISSATECFEKKFKEKTGLDWTRRNEPCITDKYRFVHQDFAAKKSQYNSIWQYWVDDGVDGKTDGWYNYDEAGSKVVEQLFCESQSNSNLFERIVASGTWTYVVNLKKMTQTNVVHSDHKVRRIRRVGPAIKQPKKSPSHLQASGSVLANLKAKKPGVSRSKVEALKATVTQSPADPKSLVVKKELVEVPVDPELRVWKNLNPSNYVVVDDYDATLNRCDITGSSNNNKYYRIQLLKDLPSGQYHIWNRWGRVGEPARAPQTKLVEGFSDVNTAIQLFEKKYKEKTGNIWLERHNCVPLEGKYEPVIVDNSAKLPNDVEMCTVNNDVEYLPCTLDAKTSELVEVIFSKEMMTDALETFNIDIRRMPLGALDKSQIEKGIAVLDEIKAALNSSIDDAKLAALSSKFYTVIPHCFGRCRPPVIQDTLLLQTKFDMCDVLMDMVATNNEVERAKEKQTKKKVLSHPADQHYLSLGAQLQLLDRLSSEFSMIQTYFEKTKASNACCQLQDVWKVDRKGEGLRFQTHENLENRRLLWHGTGIEVVAAILSSGLRIMPHSGGRVGKGLYLACEQSKSMQYTRGWENRFACMFLVEAALGKQFEVTFDDSTLRAAPEGFDSVLARGCRSPPHFVTVNIDGKNVSVPHSSPVASGILSSFFQDEYLLYKESQARLRYVVTVKM